MRFYLYLAVFLLQLGSVSSVHAQAISIKEMKIMSPSPDNCSAINLDVSKWKSVSLHNLPRHQHFCLRTQVQLDQSAFSNASLYLAILASSNLYWDGVLIKKNGVVAKNRTLEKVGKIDLIAQIPSNLHSQGIHHIAIEASNFHLDNNVRATYHGFRILETKEAFDYTTKNSISAAFVIGCLFIFSILFQLLYWLYQRQGIYQIFSLLCLFSTCLLVTEKWRVMFGLDYDLQSLRLQLVVVFTFFNSMLLPIFYLVYNQSPHKTRWLTLICSSLLVSLLLNHDYNDKGIAMYFLSLLIALLINLIALKNGKKGILIHVAIMLFGVIIFVTEPTKFTEDRFALSLLIIITAMLVSIIQEMKNNRLKSLASIRLEAELLKRNLQPHFLMNSLMLIIEWIEEKPDAAADFVQALGEELRLLVKFSGLSHVSLEEEIALCRRHIEIMSYRYDTKFSFNVSSFKKGTIHIPPAIVHTQIENAFSHNEIPDNAIFTLKVAHINNQIELTLESPFNSKANIQLPDKSHESTDSGIGERYIKSRLAECFPNGFKYQSYNEGDCWINIIQFKDEV